MDELPSLSPPPSPSASRPPSSLPDPLDIISPPRKATAFLRRATLPASFSSSSLLGLDAQAEAEGRGESPLKRRKLDQDLEDRPQIEGLPDQTTAVDEPVVSEDQVGMDEDEVPTSDVEELEAMEFGRERRGPTGQGIEESRMLDEGLDITESHGEVDMVNYEQPFVPEDITIPDQIPPEASHIPKPEHQHSPPASSSTHPSPSRSLPIATSAAASANHSTAQEDDQDEGSTLIIENKSSPPPPPHPPQSLPIRLYQQGHLESLHRPFSSAAGPSRIPIASPSNSPSRRSVTPIQPSSNTPMYNDPSISAIKQPLHSNPYSASTSVNQDTLPSPRPAQISDNLLDRGVSPSSTDGRHVPPRPSSEPRQSAPFAVEFDLPYQDERRATTPEGDGFSPSTPFHTTTSRSLSPSFSRPPESAPTVEQSEPRQSPHPDGRRATTPERDGFSPSIPSRRTPSPPVHSNAQSKPSPAQSPDRSRRSPINPPDSPLSSPPQRDQTQTSPSTPASFAMNEPRSSTFTRSSSVSITPVSPRRRVQPVASSSRIPFNPLSTNVIASALPPNLNPVQYAPARTFRQRTDLQRNPYTRERQQYQTQIKKGGNREALMRASEVNALVRAAAKADGQDVGDSLGGWLAEEDESQALKRGTFGEADQSRNGKERARDDDDEDEDEEEEDEEETDEALRVAAAAVRQRKEAKEKEEKARRAQRFATLGGMLPSSGSDDSEDEQIDELQREARRRKKREAKEAKEKQEQKKAEKKMLALGSDDESGVEDVGRSRKGKGKSRAGKLPSILRKAEATSGAKKPSSSTSKPNSHRSYSHKKNRSTHTPSESPAPSSTRPRDPGREGRSASIASASSRLRQTVEPRSPIHHPSPPRFAFDDYEDPPGLNTDFDRPLSPPPPPAHAPMPRSSARSSSLTPPPQHAASARATSLSIDRSPLARPRRLLVDPDLDSSSSEDSASGSSTSTAHNRRRSKPSFDPKKAKILNRMMPAVAANREIADIQRARDARAREAAATSRRQEAVDEAGNVLKGKSVVRRGNGKKVVVVGDDEMDASDPEEVDDQAFYAQANRQDHQVDEEEVQQRFPGWSNSEEEEEEDGGVGRRDREVLEISDSEEEEEMELELREGDIRDWLAPVQGRSSRPGARPSSTAAGDGLSVVDQLLSRTRIKARSGNVRRPQKEGRSKKRVSAEGARGDERQPGPTTGGQNSKKKPSSRAHSGGTRLNQTTSARRPSRPSTHAARRHLAPRIVLDDDSIFGDNPFPDPVDADTGARPQIVTAAVRRHPNQPAARPAPPAPRILARSTSSVSATSAGFPSRTLARSTSSVSATSAGLPARPPVTPRSAAAGAVPSALAAFPAIPWTSFERFPLSFDIHPLPPNLSFPPSSGIVQGHLAELLSLAIPQSLPRPPLLACFAFGLLLSPEMTVRDFVQVFTVVLDKAFEVLERARGMEDTEDPVAEEERGLQGGSLEGEDEAKEALRFAAVYISLLHPVEEIDALQTEIIPLLDHFLGRLEPFLAPTSSRRPAEIRIFFMLHWFLVDISARFVFLRRTQEGVEDGAKGLVERYSGVLMRRLLEHGFNRTMKVVKTAAAEAVQIREGDDGGLVEIRDVTAEIWVQLICTLQILDTALPSAQASITSGGSSTFWSLLTKALTSSSFSQTGLFAAERTWYLILGLCALSQLSPLDDDVFPPTTLSAHWPLVVQATTIVKLESDPILDPSTPASALVKRDQYVWTVLGRVHVLASEWGWRFSVQDVLLGQLVQTIFKTRKFLKLFSDPTADFPLFIRKSNKVLIESLDDSVEDGDSAFDVFLKILFLAVRDIQAAASSDGTPAAIKQASQAVSRILSRSKPIGRSPFTRASPPTLKDLSILVNRYSFSMVAVYLQPSTDNSTDFLRQMRSFLSFDIADYRSRKICIRAMMHMAVLHRHLGLDLQKIVDWFAEMTDVLLQELVKIDRPIPPPSTVSATRTSSTHASIVPAANETPKIEVIRLLLMIVGSIRQIINTPNMDPPDERVSSNVYPDPILLHRSWTQGILTSSLAQQPDIGLEVVKCVQSFLDARLASLPRPSHQDANLDSQDEFGAEFAMFDVTDPSLQALLDGRAGGHDSNGDESGGTRVVVAEEIREKDRVFATVVTETVSPAIYRLLSNMVASGDDDENVETTSARRMEEVRVAKAGYIDQLVDCWAGCASVTVQHGDQDWTSYLGLGKVSWGRMGDARARRKIGLRFMHNIAKLDPSSYPALKEHFLSVFFQTIIAPASRMTIEPEYISLILNTDQLEDPIFEAVAEERNDHGEVDFAFDGISLVETRAELLDVIFSNLPRELARNASGNLALQQRKTSLMSCIRDMLLSMIDNLSTLSGSFKSTYTTFCLDIVSRLSARAGTVFNERTLREELPFFTALKEAGSPA